jgi:hypothetical protein
VALEDELKHLDAEIRKLKIQFDLFFVGANPKPPLDQRDALEKQIKKYQGANMRNLGDRFLYNSIVNKFNAYSELWAKSMRSKEEGARVHPLAIHRAQQAALAETGGTAGPLPLAAAPAAGTRHGRVAAAARAAHDDAAEGSVWRVSTTERDQERLKSFYQEFIAAKTQVGDGKKPTFDAFAREIAKHAAALKGKVDCEAIDFKIYCKDKKVSIKAKPAK